MALEFETSKLDDVIYLRVRGVLDAQHAPEFGEQLRTLTASASGNRIVINLQQVPFMDSTGVAVLVQGSKLIRNNGGELMISQVSPNVMRVFRVTLLDQFLTFVDEAEATP
ncbi:MAG: anti-sigma factor antagonist [Chloroflexaceae bacterium]|nr:anti-sigma factor antagonist [Chloroflexaceae bacterium]NJL32765.1 anti-sigma factor antagonist [Chloroflexaceae bacterium]NJO06177.1 anti-sigma factor antagonist [Chloroflexaceae bacterium]